MYVPQNTLNIHYVTSVAVGPLEKFNGSSWHVVSVKTIYGGFCINLFPGNDSITVHNHVPKITTFGPNHCAVKVGEKTYYYSYSALIALEDTIRKVRIRSYSKTTGRHMLSMGVAGFEVIEDDEFEKLI